MKFYNLLLCMIVISISGFMSNSIINKYEELLEKKNEIQIKVNSTIFISESFRNTCEGKGFSNLNEWQKTCKAMWNLKYIGWGNAEDFFNGNDTDNSILLYGKWISEYGDWEVYSRSSK